MDRRQLKETMNRHQQLVRNQQRLIGGERFNWEDVENYEVYTSFIKSKDEVEAENNRIGDLCDINKLSFLPKPIEVSPRQEGLTSKGKGSDCHNNVIGIVNKYGGEHIVGYELVDWFGGVLLNGHSIWKTPEGKFVDVSMVIANNGIEVPRPRNALFIPLCRAKDNLWISFGAGLIVCRDEYVGMMQKPNVIEVNQLTGKGILPETDMRFTQGSDIKRLVFGASFKVQHESYEERRRNVLNTVRV